MRDLPILFSAPMVRAIINGRKTVTRRLVKPQPVYDRRFADDGLKICGKGKRKDDAASIHCAPLVAQFCPYGEPGDRLWVRETHMRVPHPSDVGLTREDMPLTWEAACAVAGTILFRADPGSEIGVDGMCWTPSIHMPRWASRITLEVTGVRVERLQGITEGQAEAEGCAAAWLDAADNATVRAGLAPSYRQGFARLWREINGDGSWSENPWVWVVEFKRIKPESSAP